MVFEKRDNTHSWVRISHGSNRFVMNLNNNEQEIPEVQLEEYALKLDARDFACRSKAKAKPQRREPAGSSPRTVPFGKRTWTDNMCIEKKTEQFNSGELNKIFRNISCILLIGLIGSGKHAWEEEEEIRKDSSTVLILQEQLCVSELFRDIQDAILLILHCRTM